VVTDPASQGVFKFDSGGPAYFSPYGQWALTLDRAGTVTLTHNRAGQITDYGAVALPAATAGPLWELIQAADVPHLESSTRQPVPDEGAFTFTLHDAGPTYTIQIWRNDALKNPRIADLIAGLGRAIEQATGQTPVLR